MSLIPRIKSFLFSKNQELTKKIGSVFLLQILGAMLAYAFQVGLARSLTLDDFGRYSLIVNYVLIGSFLTKFGLDKWSMKVVSIEEKRLNLQKFRLNLHLSSFMTFSVPVILLCAVHFTGLYRLDALFADGLLMVILIATLIKGFLEINKGFSRALFSTTISVFPVMIMVPLLSLAGLLSFKLSSEGGMILLSEGLYVFTGSLSVSLLGYYVLYLVKLKREEKTRPREYSPLQMLTGSSGIFFNGFAQMLMKRLDIVIIGILAADRDVALFSAALKINIIIQLALESTRMVIAPMIARLYSKNEFDKLNSYLIRVNKLVMVYALTVFIMVVFLGKNLLSFFGPEYIDIYPVLLLLTVANLINVGFGPTGVFMNMTGMDKVFLKIIVISLFIFIVSAVALFSEFDLYGIAMATILTNVFLNGYQGLMIFRKSRIYSGYLSMILVKILKIP